MRNGIDRNMRLSVGFDMRFPCLLAQPHRANDGTADHNA